MLDEKKLRKRVFLRVLGHPLTVLPFMLGMTTMMASWAMNWQPGLGLFAGAAGVLGAVGSFFSQILVGGDRVTRETAADLAREENEARQKALDELDQRLASTDNDPRPETSLRELRALVKAFEEADGNELSLNSRTVFDVHMMVGQMFDQCVHSLRQTDRLWQTARNLQTPAARKPIEQQREMLIEEVQASIRQLSQTLAALQTLDQGSGSQADLKRLREELDQSLAVAKTVEERVNALVKDASMSTIEEPLRPKPLP